PLDQLSEEVIRLQDTSELPAWIPRPAAPTGARRELPVASADPPDETTAESTAAGAVGASTGNGAHTTDRAEGAPSHDGTAGAPGDASASDRSDDREGRRRRRRRGRRGGRRNRGERPREGGGPEPSGPTEGDE